MINDKTITVPKEAIDELVAGLVNIFSGKLQKIILYGSVARGDDTAESDVDIAYIINGQVDPEAKDLFQELIADLDLKYDRVFSVIDIDADQYQKWINVLPYYKNIEKEGILLWKAA